MGSAPFLGGGFGHFYAYAPTKFEYPINRYAMELAPDSNTRTGVAPLRSTRAGIFEFGLASTKPEPNWGRDAVMAVLADGLGALPRRRLRALLRLRADEVRVSDQAS
jgi:hypothetical protein